MNTLAEAESTPEAVAPPPAGATTRSRAQRFLSAARALFSAMGEANADRTEGLAQRSTPNQVPGELLLKECDACEEDCPICLTTLDEGVISTPCNHKVRQ